ncbi:hypothetical protein CWI84_01795 [Idiomarina tyrosinivorans]|uniref:Two component regulator three Y domain-containing protein n=1 Tax=Idiomarina tyrosinivorans TaxID=1445662 RepID=A0A432ZU94_9GAMM|nr:hypothetical protein [Idiomarina tyrosinivorans]RUO81515.1 hypothetical protein CWI84_01795 [Idiomarina tyrosinivorans]
MLVFAFSSSVQAQQLQLDVPTAPVNEGYFTVSVSGMDNTSGLFIEVANDPQFTQNYQKIPALGDFTQLSLSGFDDGTYYLRAMADGQHSAVQTVTVEHYPLWQALSLFAAGAALFALLVVSLLLLHRNAYRSPNNGAQQ